MPRPHDQHRYDRAERNCDVVLKGGVTSGIVYPLALCELATAYQFRSIGGTSSGAIVAAFAAAAEYHRQTHGAATVPTPDPGRLGPGFRGLERFAAQLPERDRLLSTFLPDETTRPVFDVLLAGQLEQARGREARARGVEAEPTRPITRSLLALWARVPVLLPALGGAAALLATLALAWPAAEAIAQLVNRGTVGARLAGDALAVGVVLMLLLATAVGAAAGTLVATWRLVRRRWLPAIVENGFGLGRGLRAPRERAAGDEDGPEPFALTPWTTRIVNELAGRDPTGPPLTFGDLWTAEQRTAVMGPFEKGTPERPTVRFELITTCLTLGRPLRLPADLDRDPPFYFDPEEWAQYFPPRVIHHLVRHSPASRSRDGSPVGKAVYYQLPRPADIPVVVAVRMSCALPLLFSATPLWTVNTRHDDAAAGDDVLERVWFSDGGISSNFPVHFFDQLIPRWPTFAIDLRSESGPEPVDPYDEGKNVWMPRTDEPGRAERWLRFDGGASDDGAGGGASQDRPAAAARSLLRFGSSVLTTMQNWRDNALANEPGFRERIAHVTLDAQHEGGLNIAMPPRVMRRLVNRGAAVGALIRDRYTLSEAELTEENRRIRESLRPDERARWKETTVSWDRHRWVRFRIAMTALQDSLDHFGAAYEYGAGYAPLVARDPNDPPRAFPWDEAQLLARPGALVDELRGVVTGWGNLNPPMRFRAGAPDPAPQLRLTPRV